MNLRSAVLLLLVSVMLTSCGPTGNGLSDLEQGTVEQITNGPLWVITPPEKGFGRGHLGSKDASIGKPLGPFSVDYTLEGWADDDHRLIMTIRSNQSIDDWFVEFPQLADGLRGQSPWITKTQAAPSGTQRKMVELGRLPSTDRLLVAIRAKISGRTASKTIAIPLSEVSASQPRICEKASPDCFHVMSADLIEQR